MIVRLRPDHMDKCIDIAIRKHEASIQRGLQDRHGIDQYSPTRKAWLEQVGVNAECAVSLILHAEWDGGINTDKAPDVDGFQVRATTTRPPILIMRYKDSPAEPYILVKIIDDWTYDILGWAWGHEVKGRGFYDNHMDPRRPKCWYLPAHMLRPLDDILP